MAFCNGSSKGTLAGAPSRPVLSEDEMGDEDTKPDVQRKILNLRSDISLARKEIISMPRSECRKRIANFRTEGLKNQESLR